MWLIAGLLNRANDCGERTELAPEYQRIYKKTKELPIAVEIEMAMLRKADPDTLHRVFRQALLEAIIAVAEKYGLPSERLREERMRTGDALTSPTECSRRTSRPSRNREGGGTPALPGEAVQDNCADSSDKPP